jgi:hypothetical protein
MRVGFGIMGTDGRCCEIANKLAPTFGVSVFGYVLALLGDG